MSFPKEELISMLVKKKIRLPLHHPNLAQLGLNSEVELDERDMGIIVAEVLSAIDLLSLEIVERSGKELRVGVTDKMHFKDGGSHDG